MMNTTTQELSDPERSKQLVKILKAGLKRTLDLSDNNINIAHIVEQVLSESLCAAYNAGYQKGVQDGQYNALRFT